MVRGTISLDKNGPTGPILSGKWSGCRNNGPGCTNLRFVSAALLYALAALEGCVRVVSHVLSRGFMLSSRGKWTKSVTTKKVAIVAVAT